MFSTCLKTSRVFEVFGVSSRHGGLCELQALDWLGVPLLHLVVTHSLCEPPLVEPGLVTPILWGKPPDLFMARGVLVCNASAQWTVHADVYDLDGNAVETEDWQAQIIVNGFDGQFKSREPPLGCPGVGHGHVQFLE
ncbi:unnamed protein product [Symbiodinium natans]|uniref:Uncharacterized protein n=1 Tax=Symbiodinium natans TaxID=878477 RepID=A0A812TMS8_9DINO|nr:unnamed protein product [Symbiodinium natans]